MNLKHEKWTRVYFKSGGYQDLVPGAADALIEAIEEGVKPGVMTIALTGEASYIILSHIETVAKHSADSLREQWLQNKERKELKTETIGDYDDDD